MSEYSINVKCSGYPYYHLSLLLAAIIITVVSLLEGMAVLVLISLDFWLLEATN